MNGDLTKPVSGEESCRCGAEPARSAAGAWEGSALVPHGALLAFGCRAYVFSIADYLAFPYDSYPDEPAL